VEYFTFLPCANTALASTITSMWHRRHPRAFSRAAIVSVIVASVVAIGLVASTIIFWPSDSAPTAVAPPTTRVPLPKIAQPGTSPANTVTAIYTGASGRVLRAKAAACQTPCQGGPGAQITLTAGSPASLQLITSTSRLLSITIAEVDRQSLLPPIGIQGGKVDLSSLPPGSYTLIVSASPNIYILGIAIVLPRTGITIPYKSNGK